MDCTSTSSGTKLVILVGGPSKGTRFRPLSLDIPKPLFPIASEPLIYHPIAKACATIPNLKEVILIGFFSLDHKDWQDFISTTKKRLGVQIKYIKEDKRLGTMGGISRYRSEILAGNPASFFLLHCDVCCTFPLSEILEVHKLHGKECTILGKKVSPEEAKKYGCLAVDPTTKEVLHYAEKPETFVSDIINCGIYLFSPQVFALIDKVSRERSKQDHQFDDEDPNFLQLEQHLFMKICGYKHVYLYETPGFWLQIKSAGMVVKCSECLLLQLRLTNRELLTRGGDGKTSPIISGDVLIHPLAKIHPSSKLGPNVSIGANAIIGEGVRVMNSIILDGAEIKDHACVLHSIIGWGSVVGKWARIEGCPDYVTVSADIRSCGITILGAGVTAAAEIVVRSSIVLPHKELHGNYNNEVLL